MAEKSHDGGVAPSGRGTFRDSLSSDNLTTALGSRPPAKSDGPPATTGSAGGGAAGKSSDK